MNDISLGELPEKYTKAESPYGEIVIDTSVTPEIETERITRDVVRRLQKMRKEMDLKMEEKVNVSIGAKDEKSIEYLKNQEDYIKKEVRVKTLEIGEPGEVRNRRYKKKWDINNKKFELSIERIE